MKTTASFDKDNKVKKDIIMQQLKNHIKSLLLYLQKTEHICRVWNQNDKNVRQSGRDVSVRGGCWVGGGAGGVAVDNRSDTVRD